MMATTTKLAMGLASVLVLTACGDDSANPSTGAGGGGASQPSTSSGGSTDGTGGAGASNGSGGAPSTSSAGGGGAGLSGTGGSASNCLTALEDDFDDGSPDPNWVLENGIPNGTSEATEDGVLTLRVTGGNFNTARYVTKTARTLVDCQLSFEMDPISVYNSGVFLQGKVGASSGILMYATDEIVLFANMSDTGGEVGESVYYEPADHRFLRIREEAGTLYWEYSADGAAWTEQFQVATPPWAPAVKVNLFLDGYPGDSATFDKVNLAP
jgi:hypothetical protein